MPHTFTQKPLCSVLKEHHTLTTHDATPTHDDRTGGQIGANFLFFWLTAVTCVYLGGKRSAAVAKAG